MKKGAYKKKIMAACTALGTYDPSFDMAIEKLADILAEYDEAVAAVKKTGRFAEHTNKAGATNIDLSPAGQMMRQCRTDALTYLRDLGLTPAGLKKLGDKPKEDADLMSAIAKLGG